MQNISLLISTACLHRCTKRQGQKEEARRCIQAYIRYLQAGMEGSKGGTRGSGKYFTGKQSMHSRYEAYRKWRIQQKLPVLGCEKLFKQCWKAADGIVELGAKGHSTCDECAKIQVARDTWEKRADAQGRAEMAAIEKWDSLHREEHRGERDYADDIWSVATKEPTKLTMANMDAPTQDQLEIPVQPRKFRDVAKGLEDAPRWCSKMMGVMIAGLGMMCFLSHQRLGAGPNLTITCLYLSLVYACESPLLLPMCVFLSHILAHTHR